MAQATNASVRKENHLMRYTYDQCGNVLTDAGLGGVGQLPPPPPSFVPRYRRPPPPPSIFQSKSRRPARRIERTGVPPIPEPVSPGFCPPGTVHRIGGCYAPSCEQGYQEANGMCCRYEGARMFCRGKRAWSRIGPAMPLGQWYNPATWFRSGDSSWATSCQNVRQRAKGNCKDFCVRSSCASTAGSCAAACDRACDRYAAEMANKCSISFAVRSGGFSI